uniref:Uncharacterized protein n=1 Tax=Cyclophora tenuis TaxID=216820 RepID=A0A7S1D1T0_CYCTE|mmetsp:Transcript_19121/g.32746  ORF Transcript_19121/g.32746 Transcript_19121/m.32746 type:complete len:198 (+) Transcript_19121:403-996(+)
MSRIKRKSCTDAFRLLMQGNPKRRARFVLCPAGCGASIAEYQINSHLDKCFASQSDLDRIGRTKEDASELAGENRQTSNIDLERYGKAKRKGNVFEHMMDQSKTHFVKARQTFHLDENAALSWMTEPRGLDSVGSNLCWSSSFDLCSKNGQKITLTLSTSYTGRRDNIAFTDANETTTLQEQEQEQEGNEDEEEPKE